MAKTSQELHEEFEARGFLGRGTTSGIADFRAENRDWFELVEDLSGRLVKTAVSAMQTVKTTNWAREAVAVRVLLRACGSLQGIILMAERGMVAQARILCRSLIEDAFAMAALHDAPDTYLQMLRQDSDASRRLQGKFILAENLIEQGAAKDRLVAAIDAIGNLRTMSPKAVAQLGPIYHQYLAYQRLSDDSAHTSARALHKHVNTSPDGTGWSYRWSAGTADEIATSLHHSTLAGIPIGVAITEMIGDRENNAGFADISERFKKLPPVGTI